MTTVDTSAEAVERIMREGAGLTPAQRIAGLARSLRCEAGVLGAMRTCTLSREALLSMAADLEEAHRALAERDAAREALREARAWIAEERASIVDSHTVADANEWRDESTMDDLAKAAVAEIDGLFTQIDAALGPEPPHG